jgi:hypothetical protein
MIDRLRLALLIHGLSEICKQVWDGDEREVVPASSRPVRQDATSQEESASLSDAPFRSVNRLFDCRAS